MKIGLVGPELALPVDLKVKKIDITTGNNFSKNFKRQAADHEMVISLSIKMWEQRNGGTVKSAHRRKEAAMPNWSPRSATGRLFRGTRSVESEVFPQQGRRDGVGSGCAVLACGEIATF